MRPTKDQYFMSMALLASSRGTCPRRSVGAVLVNDRGHVLSTGYNGVAMGMPHCNEEHGASGVVHTCKGAHFPSGQGLDACEALHAEQNALLQCRDVFNIDTAYVTASPCITCLKLFLNTSCKRIVFLNEYPHSSSQAMWEGAGRVWQKYEGDLTLVVGDGRSRRDDESTAVNFVRVDLVDRK